MALVDEALELRRAGVDGPVLAWLIGPGESMTEAIESDIDLSLNAVWGIEQVAAAAGATGRTARIHLKIDTGLGRGGAARSDWLELVTAARKAEVDGLVRVVGIWSHLAYAGDPGHPTIDRQLSVFVDAVRDAESAGLRPDVRHLANSAATLTRPDTHFDLTRPGLAVYGLSPIPDVSSAADLGLRPAMSSERPESCWSNRSRQGQGVSYLHQYVTPRPTQLGLVPLGYADGIPRNATNVGPVRVGGTRRTVAGVVCMDQFVVDLGDDEVQAGDEVVLFGAACKTQPPTSGPLPPTQFRTRSSRASVRASIVAMWAI